MRYTKDKIIYKTQVIHEDGMTCVFLLEIYQGARQVGKHGLSMSNFREHESTSICIESTYQF